jgi:hypothetical protein
MSLIVRHQLPRIVERNVAQTLTCDVYSASSAQQTASAGTLTIKLAGVELVGSAALSASLGPPASYTLLAATTADEALNNAWLELWTLTIGGVVYTFRRPGFLVRHAYYPTITDTDLTDRDSDLLSLLATGDTTLQKYREAARQRIERDLLRKGRRPWLIFDSYDLADAHIALALSYTYRDQANKIGDGRYREEAERRLKEYDAAMGAAIFRYDDNESGNIDETTPTTANGPTILTAGPRSGRRLGRWFR